ncbi:CRAL TRIO domain protein [Aspergillus sclerotialis]|uniref:CRAL TRIO domain protein n=1 Tax=Aspergillus sclerotialis TaxID=2070753 RepID=A0A3A2ZRU6_9EURO|nr:CRAL TRIO domain protein [Aspergillus sclerotialis]
MGSTAVPTGYLGNLSQTQESNLQQFWSILLKSWDADAVNGTSSAEATPTSPTSSKSSKGFRRFSLLGSSQPQTEEELPSLGENLQSKLKEENATAEEIKSVQRVLAKLRGEELRRAYLSLLKQDHPDALLLRFLRAENFNVVKAYIKFIKALHWRVKEYNVDEVMSKGELHAVEQSKRPDSSPEKAYGDGFVVQLNTGKGDLHGCDREGRPISIVRVRFHSPNAQNEKSLNDYIVHSIETVRLLLAQPVENITLIFDLTGFSLSNWDFAAMKFVINSFQENYPESLGLMLIYNAPWIFSGFWKLLQPLLDPVVASKVQFVNGADDLKSFIPSEHILKELGGDEDREYKYVDPDPKENEKVKDTATRDSIIAERNQLGEEFSKVTSAWVSAKADSETARRDELIEQLRVNYWKLDPYIRAKSLLDRIGVIQEGGKIVFYPNETGQANGS